MRRPNTLAIENSRHYSTRIVNGRTRGVISFGSVREAHNFARENCRTLNEEGWFSDSYFLGLGTQSIPDFDNTGIPQNSVALVKKAMSTMHGNPSRPGRFGAAVCGGYWDAPSVIANLPLAARMRQRTALPPVTLRLALDFAADVSAEKIAPSVAVLAKAIHEYTKSGGTVNLSVLSYYRILSDKAPLGWFECKVNAADITNIATAFSPAYMRSVVYCIEAALSDRPGEYLPLVRENLDSSAILIVGCAEDINKSIEAAAAQLKIA